MLVRQARNLRLPQSTIATRAYHDGSPEPFHLIPKRSPKICTAEEAVRCINPNNRVFIHSTAATPHHLLRALTQRAEKESILRNIEMVSIRTDGPAEYAHKKFAGRFRLNSMFISPNVRAAVDSGDADFTPVFLRDIPRLFRSKQLPIDVALISVSPPDARGYCTLGPAVDVTRAAIQSAKTIVAFANKQMPRTLGDSIVHQSHINFMVEGDEPLPEYARQPTTEADEKIAKLVAEHLVEDGATLQIGIGQTPDAVMRALSGHRDLGIHSEMCTDNLMELVDSGVVTNAKKVVSPGTTVTSFATGSKAFYRWLHNNPVVSFLDSSHVNDPRVISRNPRVTSINSCLEIDIAGQVCAATIGKTQYSGVGGQLDFVLGSLMAPDGRAILAFPSTDRKTNKSRIVPVLQQGAAVTTSREHVQYVVTEFGIANLFGKTLNQRARELIKVAHPDHRDALLQEARVRYGPSFSL